MEKVREGRREGAVREERHWRGKRMRIRSLLTIDRDHLSALAPPILSGVQRLDLSLLVQQKVSVRRNREVSAAGRLLLYCGYGKVSWYN